jgi:protein involved in polysaccharide export with SLBB domain
MFRVSLFVVSFVCVSIFLIGCSEPKISGTDQVKAFDLAGPITPQLDIDQVLRVKNNQGIYTVGTGDVLELQIPTILTSVSPKLYKDQQQQVQPYLCRVSDQGTITLPIVGQMNVEGKTLAQIENEIVSAYYPKYTIALPSVVCNVKEYYFKDVTVVGAVTQPGVYKLKSNEMSLVNALMKAGGITEGGASIITIKNPSRKYVTSQQPAKSANVVRQLAEFDTGINEKHTAKNESDHSYLQVDLVFRPENSSPTQGTLLVQRGSDTLYTKKINLKNPAERAEYAKELRNVIGNEQAYIVGQAIEQLAAQLTPTIATSQGKQSGQEKTKPLETANDLKHNSVNNAKFIEPANNNPRPTPTPAIEDIILPVKGLNIPFADVPLMEGDLIEVKRINPAVFTVIGLAKSPGVFPYPPEVQYNLMQALGFAGGVDLIADPRFVTVYRQDAKGEVVSAVFRIDKEFMAKSCGVKIKPGDVINIDVTPRTKRNILLHQVLRINFGVFINPLSTFND